MEKKYLNTQRALVTGVAGFIGRHITEALVKLGIKVFGIDNLSGGELANVPEGVLFYQRDCKKIETYEELIPEDIVIYHCSAIAGEGYSVVSPFTIAENNVLSTISLVKLAIKKNARRFVYLSSMARYGKNEIPYKEDMTPNPVDPYGSAKVMEESVVKQLCALHNIEYNIAVPHNVVGPFQKYNDPYRNVIAITVNSILQGNKPIIYWDGLQTRSFTDIIDIIPCFLELGLNENIINEIINLGPDQNKITLNELISQICTKMDRSFDPIYIKKRPLEMKHAYCDSTKSRRLLNFSESITLSQTLDRIIEDVKKRGVRKFDYSLPIEIESNKTPVTWSNKLF